MFQFLILALASVIVLVFLVSLYQLGRESLPALQRFGVRFFTERTWNPVAGTYGAATMIIGTLVTSLAALLISVPFAVASALFVAEYAPRWLAIRWATSSNCWPPCPAWSTACGPCS